MALRNRWRFENNATDSMGVTNLSANGTPVYGSSIYREGAVGVLFDAPAMVYSNTSCGWNGSSAITIMGWVRLRNVLASGSYTFFCLNYGDTDNGLVILYLWNAGGNSFIYRRWKYPSTYADVYDYTNAVIGTWYHLCLTYDGTSLRGYTNGVYIDVATQTGVGSGTTVDKTVIGGLSSEGGTLGGDNDSYHDDWRIYNTALSASDIQDVYQSYFGHITMGAQL